MDRAAGHYICISRIVDRRFIFEEADGVASSVPVAFRAFSLNNLSVPRESVPGNLEFCCRKSRLHGILTGKKSNMVEITVKLPEEVARRFGNTPQLAAGQFMESAAVEGYRSRRLSRGQVREMLGLSWHETEELLAKHDCARHYTLEDLEADRQTLADLPAR